jgi:hypothetical protein
MGFDSGLWLCEWKMGLATKHVVYLLWDSNLDMMSMSTQGCKGMRLESKIRYWWDR